MTPGFEAPQADIDRVLRMEELIRAHGGPEWRRYQVFMNGVTMRTRVDNPRPLDRPGRDVRDGCILAGLFYQHTVIADKRLASALKTATNTAPKRHRSPAPKAARKSSIKLTPPQKKKVEELLCLPLDPGEKRCVYKCLDKGCGRIQAHDFVPMGTGRGMWHGMCMCNATGSNWIHRAALVASRMPCHGKEKPTGEA